RGCGEATVGRGGERHRAALHGREGPAAHVLLEHGRPLEIVGEFDLGVDARDLRPEHRLHPHPLPGIADGQRQLRVLQLRRQGERVAVLLQSRGQRLLAADPGAGRLGPPPRLVGQADLERCRLTVRHHHFR
ncbi:MAG: hypothetical protein ACK56I_13350, partial [bacterium]